MVTRKQEQMRWEISFPRVLAIPRLWLRSKSSNRVQKSCPVETNFEVWDAKVARNSRAHYMTEGIYTRKKLQ